MSAKQGAKMLLWMLVFTYFQSFLSSCGLKIAFCENPLWESSHETLAQRPHTDSLLEDFIKKRSVRLRIKQKATKLELGNQSFWHSNDWSKPPDGVESVEGPGTDTQEGPFANGVSFRGRIRQEQWGWRQDTDSTTRVASCRTRFRQGGLESIGVLSQR